MRPSTSNASTITFAPILVVALATFSLAQEPARETSQQTSSKRDDRSGLTERMAELTYIYTADMSPAQYIRSHPCVVGGWIYQDETDTHWIGDVHYIADNTRANSIRYVAFRLKVKKTPKVKVDMKKWAGRILLQKAKPDSAVDERLGEVSSFAVIGYNPRTKRDGIIDLHKVLPYKPAK